MSARVGVVWDDALSNYDLGPSHPLAPMRAQLAMRLSHELGLFSHVNVEVLTSVEPVERELLERVHTSTYVDAVIAASTDTNTIDLEHGLGTTDVPVFAEMHRESARVAGATLMGARAVLSGNFEHVVSLSGGHHHAMPDAAEGFCVYNDLGVAIQWLLDEGYERIAYLDLDVHHGDGVQAIFWDEPRVVTISIHESPVTLFPGSGFPAEIGGPNAQGSAVNLALPAGTGDQGWLRAFSAVVPDILQAFQPQILVTQQGADAHLLDPLGHLTMSIDGQRMSYELVHRWAHEYADGKWLAVGGGGYACPEVVPRAWTHLIAEVTGHPIDPASMVPEVYRDFVQDSLHRPSPERMTDGQTPWPRPFEFGFDPEDRVDQAVLATRKAVYPSWGLVTEPVDWY
ncbi:MAG: acetoin utilization protein AcuC [Actinomycetota bacterium]|nr:acetoin utilization protein AcuC [Actinomycetota bacterium]